MIFKKTLKNDHRCRMVLHWHRLRPKIPSLGMSDWNKLDILMYLVLTFQTTTWLEGKNTKIMLNSWPVPSPRLREISLIIYSLNTVPAGFPGNYSKSACPSHVHKNDHFRSTSIAAHGLLNIQVSVNNSQLFSALKTWLRETSLGLWLEQSAIL